MINVTGLDRREFIINADHIEKVEEVPETLITLTNGKKYLVLEKSTYIKDEVIKYKNQIYNIKL